MYYTVYKVTNQISGKFYIGTHKTKDLNDGYMGSGKYLKRAIEKHGLINFTKEILFVFDNPEDMFSKEAEIVTEEFISEENTYNIKIGGMGGWDYNNTVDGQKLREFSYPKWSKSGADSFLNKFITNNCFRKKHIEHLKNISILGLKRAKTNNPHSGFFKKKHKEETKKLISEKAKQRLTDPTKNSQYGTMWITDGKESKKINKVDFIPEGWYKGRVIKIA